MDDASTIAPPLFNLAGQPGSGGVSPLEQEVLDEYARLLRNMSHVRFSCFIVYVALLVLLRIALLLEPRSERAQGEASRFAVA